MTGETNGRLSVLSGSTLKIIAIISMLTDHIGLVVVCRFLFDYGSFRRIFGTDFLSYNDIYNIYHVMRGIGRIAFPIYCFLLIEGFEHTRDVRKYAARLFGFAIISEIPFDLSLFARPFAFAYQNVFFTLFISLVTMALVRWAEGLPKIKRYACTVFFVLLGMAAAALLHTDYGYKGVICIMLMYFFRKSRAVQSIVTAIAFLWEFPASLAAIFIYAYNGKRGIKLKYFFYAFYPAHLLILYLICVAAGTGGVVLL